MFRDEHSAAQQRAAQCAQALSRPAPASLSQAQRQLADLKRRQEAGDNQPPADQPPPLTARYGPAKSNAMTAAINK